MTNLIERVIAQLPGLNPHNTVNTTPGRERVIQLKDADGVVLDTIDVTAGDEENWIGFMYNGTRVASCIDITPVDRTMQEQEDDADIAVQEGLANRLAAIEARLTALETP